MQTSDMSMYFLAALLDLSAGLCSSPQSLALDPGCLGLCTAPAPGRLLAARATRLSGADFGIAAGVRHGNGRSLCGRAWPQGRRRTVSLPLSHWGTRVTATLPLTNPL